MVPLISITIPTYVLIATIGAIIAALFLYLRAEKYEIGFSTLLIYAAVSGITLLIGSKIVFAIGSIPLMENGITFMKILRRFISGGIVFYGGMLGFIGGVFILSRIRKDNSFTMLNFFAPAIPLFHAFGRLGCFFGGCCYGVEASWGFPMAADIFVSRFPVQLAESLCNVIIFIVICNAEKKKASDANLLLIYLFMYSVCRFILEFFRGDKERGLWGAVSTSQIISIVVFLTCSAFCIIKAMKKGRKISDGAQI